MKRQDDKKGTKCLMMICELRKIRLAAATFVVMVQKLVRRQSVALFDYRSSCWGFEEENRPEFLVRRWSIFSLDIYSSYHLLGVRLKRAEVGEREMDKKWDDSKMRMAVESRLLRRSGGDGEIKGSPGCSLHKLGGPCFIFLTTRLDASHPLLLSLEVTIKAISLVLITQHTSSISIQGIHYFHCLTIRPSKSYPNR